MSKDFLGFLVAAGLCQHEVDHLVLIMFMQYLSENGFSVANIANYMAEIRSQHIIHDIDTSPFRHDQIQFFSTALKNNRPLNPRSTTLIDIKMLNDIISVSKDLQFPLQFTALYSLDFSPFKDFKHPT